jgi:hypothetical protein
VRTLITLLCLTLAAGCSRTIDGRVARVRHGGSYMDIVFSDGRFIQAVNTALLDTGDVVRIRFEPIGDTRVTHIWNGADVPVVRIRLYNNGPKEAKP